MNRRALAFAALSAGCLAATSAGAQAIYCPDPSSPSVLAAGEPDDKARVLLDRFLAAFGLHGQPAIDPEAIIAAQRNELGQFADQLTDLAERCGSHAAQGPEPFEEHRPVIRRELLEILYPVAGQSERDRSIRRSRASSDEIPAIEQQIDFSVRELWETLWFRPLSSPPDPKARWAVIVASPEDEGEAWAVLREHQQRWQDVYFELYYPYRGNPYYALVVGRRLAKDEAAQLEAYVKELGMAPDSFSWQLPLSTEASS